MAHEGQLFAEVASVARVLHWSLSELLDLDHQTRRQFMALAAGDDA